MLKDKSHTQSEPSAGSLNVSPNVEVEKILEFVDQHIQDFPLYFKEQGDAEGENRITDFLIHHFQMNKNAFPFDFRKNPTQPNNQKETDLGVMATTSAKLITIIEFEAKRLLDTSSEYVYGDRGGIERFKRGHHGSHLTVCGMLGYIQRGSSAKWIKKINKRIKSQSKKESDINWENDHVLSQEKALNDKVKKLYSKHTRIDEREDIALWHYLIDLC